MSRDFYPPPKNVKGMNPPQNRRTFELLKVYDKTDQTFQNHYILQSHFDFDNHAMLKYAYVFISIYKYIRITFNCSL